MVLYITIKAGITMTPEDFDISFDFDKEYDLDPNANKSSFDDDFDLDAALERELGPDFDRLFEEEFAASQAALNAKYAAQQKTSRDSDEDDEEDDHSPIFGAFSNFDDNEDLLPEEAEEGDRDDGIYVSRFVRPEEFTDEYIEVRSNFFNDLSGRPLTIVSALFPPIPACYMTDCSYNIGEGEEEASYSVTFSEVTTTMI